MRHKCHKSVEYFFTGVFTGSPASISIDHAEIQPPISDARCSMLRRVCQTYQNNDAPQTQ